MDGEFNSNEILIFFIIDLVLVFGTLGFIIYDAIHRDLIKIN